MNGRRMIRAVTIAALAGTAATTLTPQAARAASIPPPIKHVVVIVLENSGAANNFAFGKALAPYLNNTLVPKGVEIPLYYGTGHASLDNYIAMVSGQGPNPRTQGDCNDPSTLSPGTLDSSGQAVGAAGCTYPANVLTIADQLTTAGYSWKGYMEDMGNSPTTARDTCRGPGAPVNAAAPPVPPGTTDKYATKHNPFVYFSSITGLTHTDNNAAGSAVSYNNLAFCDAHDVPLPQLSTDLATPGGLPNLSYITPNLCSDGHDVCGSSNPDNGLAQADNFLATWVPKILANPAFQPGGDGLLVVNWDEGEGESTSCCNEQPGPNLSLTAVPPQTPGNNTPPGPGGGQTGAVAVGPYIAPNSPLSTQSYNHYSLLRSIEDIFGLSHLGFAGATGLASFGSDVYTNAAAPVNTPEAPVVALLLLPAVALLAVGRRRRSQSATAAGTAEH